MFFENCDKSQHTILNIHIDIRLLKQDFDNF